MFPGKVSILVVTGILGCLAPYAAGQCRGGGGMGQSGGQGVGLQYANSFQSPGLNPAQQGYLQQAAIQQAYAQQLQRAILQQRQYALQKAQEREASRQRRLAAATARREKDAKRRAEQEFKTPVALTVNK